MLPATHVRQQPTDEVPEGRVGLTRTVEFEGVGLHSGAAVRLRVGPGRVGCGYQINGRAVETLVRAEVPLCSAVDTATGRVLTTEHLLAALYGLAVDDVEITVFGGEVPALDGSAAPFVKALVDVMSSPMSSPMSRSDLTYWRRPIRVDTAFRIEEGEAFIEVSRKTSPSPGLRLEVSTDFPGIGTGRFEAELSQDADAVRAFVEELAPARTFGFFRDEARLRAAGLARGVTLDNCLIFGDDGRAQSPLRFADEVTRHKALDLLGDLALLGRPLNARVVAHRAGHALHRRVVTALARLGARGC